MYEQPAMFPTEHDPAPARGPIQSDLTLQSLGRDDALKHRIAQAVVRCSERTEYRHYDDGDSIAVLHNQPVTDDAITEWLERAWQRRFQRNVIARTRGLMEVDGWFDPVPDVIGRTGRPTHAVIPSQRLIDLLC